MRVEVKKDERVLVYKDGDYFKLLKPGLHKWFSFSGFSVERYSLDMEFMPPKHLNLYLDDKELVDELEFIDVQDGEIALYFEDGYFNTVLEPGRHAFWKSFIKRDHKTVSLQDPNIDPTINRGLFKKQDLAKYLSLIVVEPHENALLYFDEVYQTILKPGQHYFWNGTKKIDFTKVDLRQLQLNMAGQEIMTKDKVTIRVNFICQYKIVDPVKALVEIDSYGDQLYILMQLILREYIGTLSLDELLIQKEDIADFVLAKLKEKVKEWGLEILVTGVKDIILPGEIKTILNQVIEAEKKAQANIIMRREETASTRSLLNTAKLMENSPTLMKLKELEHIEKIAERINNLSLVGGASLIEQFMEIFKTSGDKK